jgi:hypothetical protein
MRTIPSDLELPGLGEIAHPRAIEGEEWQQVIQAGHYRWVREGMRCGLLPVSGRGLDAPDHAQTSSTSYTQDSGGTAAKLSQTQGVVRAARLLAGAGVHRWRLKVFAAAIIVRVQWSAVDEPGLYGGSASLTFGATAQWLEVTYYGVPPVELKGGTGPLLRQLRHWLSIRVASGTGHIYQAVLEDDQQVVDADMAVE